MRKLIFLSIIFLFASAKFANASHNRAGEITFRHLQLLKYEIKITTYTKTSSANPPGNVDRPVLDSVHLGDGTMMAFQRSSYLDIPGDIRINVYIGEHTYPGSGTDTIWFVDPNRNGNVINVPNSFFTPFAIYTILNIGGNLLPDNSPVLLNPPIDSGCVGIPFLHNPAAYDPDGDSLSYQLIVCHGEGNLPIPGYSFPYATDSFTLNPVTGDLVWASPDSAGEYNVAFLIIEWRNIGGTWYRIGEVERDMQIRIIHCPINFAPPQILPVADTCVLAGDTLAFNVTAFDPNHEFVTLSSVGSPYIIPTPAVFTPPINNSLNDTVTGLFTWHTNCSHVARQPYQVTFRANDINSTISLVTYESVMITVIAPPITGLTVDPNGNTMMLHWNPNACANVAHYNIYHRVGSYPGVIECPCQTGVPAYTGYTLIGTTDGLNDTTFIDSNNGAGLAIGISHCYMVTAVFADGSESCSSIQVCNQLKKDLPVITNVTVVTTGAAGTGSDTIAWSKATEIDTTVFHRPYQYKVLRSDGDFIGSNFQLIATLPVGEDDTIYFDNTNLNTQTQPNSYKIELYYDSDNDGVPDHLKGNTQTASSVFLTLAPTDKRIILSWQEHVPWTNYRYDIFKQNAGGGWDSIATTTQHTYSDDSLINGVQYCYYVRSIGSYGTAGIVDPIINLSERTCATAIDNVPPCPPDLTVGSDCIENVNFLQWTNPNHSCTDDVLHYNIYFSSDGTNYELINITHIPTDTTLVDRNLPSLAGCYKVTAVDSVGNESAATAVCVDTCRQYVLPSVFTPNGDHNNDFYHPCDSTTALELQHKNCPPYKNVKDIDLKIYNRWGNLVYETTDKDINWDGKNKFSKGDCPDGVYYYTCIVNFFRLHGTQSVQLHGYLHLIRGK